MIPKVLRKIKIDLKLDNVTNLIADGGFFIDLTMVISDGLRVLSDSIADSKAGIAWARSLSQSSFIA